MKKLHKYLLNNFLKTFISLIALFSLVVVSSQLLNLPSSMYRSGFLGFLKALLLINFSFFKIELLFAFLIASMLTTFMLKEKREIYAIYSTGISKSQLMKPFILVTAGMSIFALITSLFLVPWANRERSKFFTLSVKEHFLESIQKKNFFELTKGITIYVHNKEDNRVDKIFIYNRDTGQAISAKEGLFEGTGLIMKNGYIQIPEKKNFSLLKFKKYSLNFNVDYVKKYSITYYKNSVLWKIYKTKAKEYRRALSILVDRFTFIIPFMFMGILGFYMGLSHIQGKDYLIGLSVVILIVYMVINFLFLKLIEKNGLHPAIYVAVVFAYFSFVTNYFRKRSL